MDKEQPIDPPEPIEEEEFVAPPRLKDWQLERTIIWAVSLINDFNNGEWTENEIFDEIGIDACDYRAMVERDELRRYKLKIKKEQLKKEEELLKQKMLEEGK